MVTKASLRYMKMVCGTRVCHCAFWKMGIDCSELERCILLEFLVTLNNLETS